jgi:hypothetical protein
MHRRVDMIVKIWNHINIFSVVELLLTKSSKTQCLL